MEAKTEIDSQRIELLKELAEYLRINSFRIIKHAGSGHLGACSSSAELLTALYFGGILRFDPENPKNPNRDKVMLRGHLGPMRYQIFELLGLLTPEELECGYREMDTRLKGHESMMTTPGVDITPSGSLGMVLSYGVGAAIAAKNQGLDSIQYVFLGDGEEQEGNVSEAARHAATLKLDNLICILDQNGKQLSRKTSDSDGETNIKELWKAYGWEVLEINGHSIEEILLAFRKAQQAKRPVMILAKTIKGKGIEGCQEHFSGYHTLSTCKTRTIDAAIKSISDGAIHDIVKTQVGTIVGKPLPKTAPKPKRLTVKVEVDPNDATSLDDSQVRYFSELRRTLESSDASPDVYMVTADFVRKDIVRMCGLDKFLKFIDVGIREQHMISMIHGIAVSDPSARVLVNYGDAFIYRPMDQLNAAAQGQSRMTILSEYAGLSQGQNGETHQSVGQPASLATMPGVRFYEPGDVQDLYTVLNKSLTDNDGIDYVRIHRENIFPLPRIEVDPNWRNYMISDNEKPDALIVTSGLVAGHSLEGARILLVRHGVKCRVINVVDHGSINGEFARKYLLGDVPTFTTYNGSPRVLGSSVAEAAFSSRETPKPAYIKNHGYLKGDTGRVKDLLRKFKLDPEGIVEFIRSNL